MPLTEIQDDKIYIDALVHSLQIGSNFTEIALGYGHGNALRLFKDALNISIVPREDVFVTHSFYPRDFDDFKDIEHDAKEFYEVMDTDYADSVLVTQSLILRFGESKVYSWLHALLDNGNTRYVSLSNASPTWIRKFKDEFKEVFFAHEGHLSFEVRALQDKGVLSTCKELGVENIIWRPLRRSATLQHNWPLLYELSTKYDKSQSQIILNWMIQSGLRPMVFSTNIDHIDENIDAVKFEMEATDYQRISDFRPGLTSELHIDWEGIGIDDDIVNLVMNSERYTD